MDEPHQSKAPPSDPPSSEGAADSPPVAAFATVWLTLFLDLVAFGIVIPVLPYYAESFGASAFLVTLLSTSFSLAQFMMSPVLGRLSDRFGRRPVMLISIAGSCASLAVLAFAHTLWMIFTARIISGMCNANIATANAYVADRVSPEKRAKYMGMMGAAIGLGFVFGPAIGGLLSTPEYPELPFLVAAVLAGINWLMALKFLPESRRTQRSPATAPVRAPGGGLLRKLRVFKASMWGTALGWIVLVNFLFFLAFAAMESTFALLMERKLGWQARETGMLFTLIGVVIVVTQGVLVGRTVGRFGEKRTLLIGMGVLAVGLCSTGLSPGVPLVVLGAALIALGNGLVTPSINASVSRLSSSDDQGLNLGVNASAASLARIAGPAAAGGLFEAIAPNVPMLAGAVVVGLAAVVAMFGLRSSL